MISRPFGIASTASIALAVSAALTGATVAQADDQRKWYVAPALNFVLADDDRQADNDAGFQIGLGRQISERWNLELNLEADNLDFEAGNGSYKQRGAALDGLFFFNRNRGFSPYGLIGVGALHNRLPGDNVTNAMGNVGLGFLSNAGGAMTLRTEVRYRWDDDDETIPSESGFGDWIFSLGVHIPLGRAAPVAAPVAAVVAAEPAPVPVAPIDSDGDGVSDANDVCPNTPAGASVDARGCELDGDGDGVPDSRDRCPGTVAGAAVDANGCERDSDGDGVVDRLDRCADTVSGVKVDVRGCEIKEVISLPGVNFATSSARLLPESAATLDEAAATLLKHPEIKAEVTGHTDSTGPRAFNVKLSRERAEAVKTYLVSQGVAADRLTAAGYGPDRPVADNATNDGRAANRRVELQIAK